MIPVARRLLASLVLLTTGLASAQSRVDAGKYWIFFTDKAAPSGKTELVSVPLPDRTHARRRLRGRPAPPADLDAPVSPRYLAALRAGGIEPLVRSRWLNAVSARLDGSQLAYVRRLSFVRGVRPVARLAPVRLPDPPPLVSAPRQAPHTPRRLLDYGASEQQLALVNAIAPLERGINGAGVRLGILDTGIGNVADHPAFARLIAEGRLIAVEDFTNQPDDGSRHGRAVLSVATGFDEGNLIGPAYGAEVLAARTEYTPTETNQEEDNFVAGLEWLEAMGVDVVNSSLGYSTFDDGERSYTYADMNGDTAVTTRVADMAVMLGVVFVSSAGNEGGCGAPSPSCWFYITSPADGDSVITVGAVDVSGERSSFSSFGPTSDGRLKPDVAALGRSVYIASADPGYSFSAGTSFSSPMVAGVVAQMLQVNPALTPIQVRDILRETASQPATPDSLLGWGIIDADAAVLRAEAMLSSTEDDATPPATAIASVETYPNPSRGTLTFEVQARLGPVPIRLAVFDLLGRRVALVFEGTLQPGLNRFPFSSANLPAGLYVYRLSDDRHTRTGKLILLP